MLFDYIDVDKVRKTVFYALLLLALLFVQNQFGPRMKILGVVPFFIPAAAVCAGVLEGGTRGAVFGLFVGILTDMSYGSGVLFTVLFPILAFLTGLVTEFFVNRRFFAYFLLSIPALLLTAFFQMFRILLLDPGSLRALAETALVQTLWSLPFAALIYLPFKALAAYEGD